MHQQQIDQQQQQLDLHRQQLQEAAQARRQMLALNLQKQQQAVRQQHFTNFLAIDKQFGDNPEQWDQQMTQLAARGNPDARMALEVGDKKMRGEYASVEPLISTYFPEFAKKYGTDPSSVSKSEVKAVLNNVMDIKKRRAAADADAMEYGALKTVFEKSQLTGEPMNPGDLERFQQLHADKTEKSLKLAKLQAEINAMNEKKDQGPSPVRNDTIDIPSIAITGQPFASIPREAVVTPEHLSRGLAAGFDTSQLSPGMPLQSAMTKIGLQQAGKLAQTQQFSGGLGRGDVPVGVESNLYTKLLPDGTAQAIHDPSMGKIEAGKQGYRDTVRFKENLDRADKGKSALRMMGDLQNYASEIVKAQGGPIETTLQGWKLGLAGITKAGALTNLTAPNGKRLTVGEVSALYEDKANQIADQLARGGGMVGVATEQDTLRSLKGLTGRYETAQMAGEKFRTFKSAFGNNILQEFDRAYGREGVPATLREHLKKGELPTQSKLPAKQFLQQQEKAYRDQGFQDEEIRALLKRDFRDMGYE